MIGDLYFFNGKAEESVSEELITIYPQQETDKQQAARTKTGKPMPSFQITVVKTRPVRFV